MAAGKLTRRGRTTGYRRRKPLPALAAFIVLCVVAGVVWVTVFDSKDVAADRTSCNGPVAAADSDSTGAADTGSGSDDDGSAKQPGTNLDNDALDNVAPAEPGGVKVRVLNAGGQRGQAGLVTLALKQLGFQPAAAPGNDPFYPKGQLRCDGQIRFGPDGAAAARTLSLVDPCAQLVRDDRQDATVDFAIGTMFHDATPNKAAGTVLERLSDAAENSGHPQQGGDSDSADSPGDGASDGSGAHVDQDLIAKARDVDCN